MQRIPFLMALCCLPFSGLQAQSFPKNTWRAQLGLPLAPSVNVQFENRLGHTLSAVAKAEANTQFGTSSSLGTTGSVAYVLSGELRWYHNVNRRIGKGRSIDKFSGNFISAEPFVKAAETKYGNYLEYFPPLYPDAGLLFSYGMQRGFGNNGHWGFCAGVAPIAVLDGGWATVVKINFQIGLQW